MSDKKIRIIPPQKLLALLPVLESNSVKRTEVESEIPTVTEIVDRFITPNTLLVYREKPIEIQNSPQSTVKFLDVNVCSMETQDIALLHKLHTKTRQI